MEYIQIALTIPLAHAEQLGDDLAEAGAMSVTVESADGEKIFDAALPGDPQWQQQRLTVLFDHSFDVETLAPVYARFPEVSDIQVTQLADQAWERKWLEQFKPLKISDGLWICPSWLTPPDENAINITIDPGLAFGTGTHQTTFLCLQKLARLSFENELVLDYGCGSGILGIAALKLGARRVVAIDLDPKAVDATRSNAEINAVNDQLQCGLPSECDELLQGEQPTVIIANILADTLIELRSELAERLPDNGMLLLSGILEQQEQLIAQHYAGMFDFASARNDDWMLMTGRKIPLADQTMVSNG